ncbi:beta-ketothiolase BktB [Acidisoma cellulosilytica]|uniref:Beta-ketothiolase BktB n=1 Tax=Acidisoma cellulosilyticum TaxID=2802395 RepID=A0A964E5K3_9PROT|nr:beta-ketothiolase BktB [Acidisoma cellulosilyticum]MCB8882063.1 beta-ketothiolase BktB [Acidisoma cellulosilyticum]
MSNREVVFVSAVRTAIGGFGRSLKDVPPTALASLCIREAVSRAAIRPSDVEHVVFGNVIHTEPRDAYLSRVAAIDAGLPDEVPCLTLNRLCGSGLQAVVSASQAILLGDVDCAVAGGAESMSRGGYLLDGARWGVKMGSATAVDMVLGALTDPFGHGHMGVTAENVAKQCGVSREVQDQYAAESHRRAAAAIAEGRFREQIVAVEVKSRKDAVSFAVDEHVRSDIDLPGLAKLKPVFDKAGSVTAANASGLNDGAAALVLMDKEAARQAGCQVMGRMLAYAHAGVDAKVMGLGPITAVRKVLKRAGLSLDDMDIIESNEAFAAQACAVADELGFPAAKTNPNGGAIALGHPIGATGAILLVKALYELQRIEGRYGLITMCIGGGQGIAMIIERPRT